MTLHLPALTFALGQLFARAQHITSCLSQSISWMWFEGKEQHQQELEGGADLGEVGVVELCIELLCEGCHVACTAHHCDALCIGVVWCTAHPLIICPLRPAVTSGFRRHQRVAEQMVTGAVLGALNYTRIGLSYKFG